MIFFLGLIAGYIFMMFTPTAYGSRVTIEGIGRIPISFKNDDDVFKFRDGDVTCYVYSRGGGISCLNIK